MFKHIASIPCIRYGDLGDYMLLGDCSCVTLPPISIPSCIIDTCHIHVGRRTFPGTRRKIPNVNLLRIQLAVKVTASLQVGINAILSSKESTSVDKCSRRYRHFRHPLRSPLLCVHSSLKAEGLNTAYSKHLTSPHVFAARTYSHFQALNRRHVVQL